MSKDRTALPLILGIAAAGPLAAEPDWTARGFDMPGSTFFDTDRNRIVLSTVIGHPGDADGEGTLALLSPDGETIDAEWVTGLDAPKGMAAMDDTLLVADLTRLHVIDLETGEILRSIAPRGAVFLNDVTSDGTTAYVTDFVAQAIWRYTDGNAAPWLESTELSHPNGILLDGDRLIVASWGPGMRDDFTTDAPGALLSVSLDNREIATIAPDLGNIDGVAQIGETIYASDWMTGDLFAIGPSGTARVVGTYPAGLADISSHGNTLYLPGMLEGTVSALEIPPGELPQG